MSEEERRERERRQAWYEMRKRRAESSPTSKRPGNESPLDLKTKPSHKSQQNTNIYHNKRIKVLEDKIIHEAPLTHILPNVDIKNNNYEPISPPENTRIVDDVEPNTNKDKNTEAITTVEDEIPERPIASPDLTLKRNFENSQDETTDVTHDAAESKNDDNDIQNNMYRTSEKILQEVIKSSNEYKKYIISVFNKVKKNDIFRNMMTITDIARLSLVQLQTSFELNKKMEEQRMNAAAATNPLREDVHIANEGINAIPVNAPVNEPPEAHNNPLYNKGPEQNRMMHTNLNAMNYPNVPYESQAPRYDWQQNEQEAVQTKTNNRYPVYTHDSQTQHNTQQFIPHTYIPQRNIPDTSVPNAQRFPAQSDQQQVYSNTDVPNFPQQRWDNPAPVEKHQPHIQKVIPSDQSHTYPERKSNPTILVREQTVPHPVHLRDQQHIERTVPGVQVRYPDRNVPINQQHVFPDPALMRSQYAEPADQNYEHQNYNEPVVPNDQRQCYTQGTAPSSLPASRKSRHQSQHAEQIIPPGQQQIYSEDRVPQNIQQMKCPDPYVIKNQQQMHHHQQQINHRQQQIHHHQQQQYSKQQNVYRCPAPSEIPQRYSNPVIPPSQHPRVYDPNLLNSQPYRHPVPPAPYIQQRIDRMQHPASVRWQQVHSFPPLQAHPVQYAPPPQMVRQMTQPPVPDVPSNTQQPEQVPEYYEQYYNHYPENPHAYQDPNYYHPSNSPR